MKTLLNQSIHDVIDAHPSVGEILQAFGISCATCRVGTCLLKDIVSVHTLTPEQERALMARIEKTVYPDRDVEVPDIPRIAPGARATQPGPRPPAVLSLSPPLRMLIDEHNLIKRLLALVPAIAESLDLNIAGHQRTLADCLEFMRSYADKHHHAKEENILFKYFDQSAEIIQVMHADHTAARAHVQAMLSALDMRDTRAASSHLIEWRDLLVEHIRKEDEILYPWMERNLTTRQVGTLYDLFQHTEKIAGNGITAKYERLVDAIEARLTGAGIEGSQDYEIAPARN